MGLIEDSQGIYVNVTAGKLRKKCDKSDPKAKKRVEVDDNDKETIHWERVWKGVEGLIVGINLKKGRFGRQYVLIVQKDNDVFNLYFNYESKYSTTLIERLPNVNFSKPITLIPYSVKDVGKEHPNTGVTIWQDEKRIQSFYRKLDDKGYTIGWLNNAPEKPPYDPDNYNENEGKKYKIDFYEFLENTLEDIQQKIFEANPVDYEVDDEHGLPANEKTMDEEAGNKAPPLKAEDEH